MTGSFGSPSDLYRRLRVFVVKVRNQEANPEAGGQLPPGEQSSQFST